MKLVLFIILLLPFAVVAQDVPPKANTIIVKGVSFSQVCSMLLDSGYSIEKKDDQLQTVRTEHKIYPKHFNAAYAINVQVKDSSAYITATFTAPWDQFLTPAAAKTDPLWKNEPVYNITNKKGQPLPKSIVGYPFLLVKRFAEGFGKPIEYIKQ